MNYKARFRPHELLGDYRHWQPAAAGRKPPLKMDKASGPARTDR